MNGDFNLDETKKTNDFPIQRFGTNDTSIIGFPCFII